MKKLAKIWHKQKSGKNLARVPKIGRVPEKSGIMASLK
jgi:hypothetical protein